MLEHLEATEEGGSAQCLVRLRCRHCKSETLVVREPYEPESIAVITCLCPGCEPDGYDDLEYLDKDGNRIDDPFSKPND